MSTHALVDDEMNGHHAVKPPRPLIWREMESATEINRILNDDSIFPAIAVPDQPPFDVTPVITNPDWVFLRCDGGVIFFAPDSEPGSGIYEGHTNFLEGHRGLKALQATVAAIDWLFTSTPCAFLYSRIPADNIGAIQNMKNLSRAGVEWWFTKPNAWPRPAPQPTQSLQYYCLSLHDWLRHSVFLSRSGDACREHLSSEFARLGHPRELTPGDSMHDRMFATAIEMLKAGQWFKGLVLHNRWARAAGAAMMTLVSHAPLVIDAGDCLIAIDADGFRVIKVK